MPETAGFQIAVISGDSLLRTRVTDLLTAQGYSVVTAEKLDSLRHDLPRSAVAIIAHPNAGDSLEELMAVRKIAPDTQVLFVNAHINTLRAQELLQEGAFWIWRGDFIEEEMLMLLAKAVVLFELSKRNRLLTSALGSIAELGEGVFLPPELQQRVGKIASLDEYVLITGESGTGKTLIARQIHSLSQRRDAPFVSLSCAAIPRDLIEAELFGYERGAFTSAHTSRPGSFEVADGGTIFLDEIGDLPLELQPKLLTVLQDQIIKRLGSNTSKSVNVRVIAATNQPLQEMVGASRFRRDLYFRLNVLTLELPTLRERKAEIIPLAQHILARITQKRGGAKQFELNAEAKKLLVDYTWPGNIRELENVLERATAFCDSARITAKDIQFLHTATESNLTNGTLEDVERKIILDRLEAFAGDKVQTAQSLGISLKTLYNKLERYGYSKSDMS